VLLPGPTSDYDPPTSASQVAGITSVYHHAPTLAVLFNRILGPTLSLKLLGREPGDSDGH
jgi:hypothetical protein